MRARRFFLGLVALMIGLAALVLPAGPAWAAADTYDRFDVAYTIRPDGVLEVQETVVLRFGSSSGRHGYERFLVTREIWDEERDARYEVSAVEVSSPDAGVPTDTRLTESTDGRTATLRIRIGDPNVTIRAATATYALSYEVRGALRTFSDYDEFYWDVTGSSMGSIASSTVTVAVPGGVMDGPAGLNCYAGPPRSSVPCETAAVDGEGARFVAADVAAGELVTVGVKINPGQVSNPGPLLEERADADELRLTRVAQGAGLVGAAAVPVAGWLYYRRRGRDERYAGLPPGTFPARGQRAAVTRHDPDLPIPVSFAPPELPLMHAGYVLEGRSEVRHLTATLVGLAVHGAIRLQAEGRPTATLVDPRRAPDGPSATLLAELFDGQPVVALDEPGELHVVRETLEADAAAAAARGGWFRRVAAGRRSGSALGLVWVVVMAAFFFDARWLSGSLLWFVGPLTLSLVVTLLVVRSRMARGQRSAAGRAWTDQVEGFRTYIATAEAEQLRFEEGEDIFSKYLPWAILFGLAERWVQVCQQAISLGLIAEPDYGWYGGTAWNPNIILWNVGAWDSSLATAAAPVPDFSADTGFGGGSSFGGGGFGGGGGFSGGGGGGGGGGSW